MARFLEKRSIGHVTDACTHANLDAVGHLDAAATSYPYRHANARPADL